MTYFVPWTGGRANFTNLDEAFAEAFKEASAVLEAKGPTKTCRIVLFDEDHEMIGYVERSHVNWHNSSWPEQKSTSPASFPTGELIELTPEEAALVQAHRAKIRGPA